MKENKLRAKWSKREKDIIINYPLGIQTNCDMGYLFYDVFTKEFKKEMKERGYDIETLKFEIKVDEKGERFKEKFPTLSKEIEEKN